MAVLAYLGDVSGELGVAVLGVRVQRTGAAIAEEGGGREYTVEK